MIQRVVCIVLDSVGIGALPDAASYDDAGSNTLGNIAKAVTGGLHLPNLGGLGIGHLTPIRGVPPAPQPSGAYGRLTERSAGKDSIVGHWELMGLVSSEPFPTYPDGFPPDLISDFEERIGRKILGNCPASGTVIIEELGRQHLQTGYPIVYTSADSVFQVAAHEDVIPLQELYRICRIARELLVGEHRVARVIARPFVGEPGHFLRTEERRDFAAPPPQPTVLDHLKQAGYQVIGVGKVGDIFSMQGLTDSIHAENNMDGVDEILRAMHTGFEKGLLLANLGDFDTRYGHRNNPEGYAQALEALDARLPEIERALRKTDVLIITADHGCDPTIAHTDHTREYTPCLVAGAAICAGVDLGTRSTFADVGATIAQLLNVQKPSLGTSFAEGILLSQEEQT
ncbi:MAG: phosphopentomutase [Chloroflexota bacterium]|nr:phosphopentomutase [Chloroflexota bacterium]